MVSQHSSMGKSLLWYISYNFLNAKVGTCPLSYAVIPSFISCFTTFYYIDPYFIFFINNLKKILYIIRLESIMVQKFAYYAFWYFPNFCLLCLFLRFLEMYYTFILCDFSLCREVLHIIECKWRSVNSTAAYK